MKAEQMFEALGYKKGKESTIVEQNSECYMREMADGTMEYILLDYATKDIVSVYDLNESREIEIEEMKAIIQRMKELGWID